MAAGALVRMAMAPLLALASYWAVSPVSPTAGMAVGAVVMLALALLPGTGRRATTTFTQG